MLEDEEKTTEPVVKKAKEKEVEAVIVLKTYTVLKPFTLDKFYPAGAKIELKEGSSESLIINKYIK